VVSTDFGRIFMHFWALVTEKYLLEGVELGKPQINTSSNFKHGSIWSGFRHRPKNCLQAIKNALARAVTKNLKHHQISSVLENSTGSEYMNE